MKNRIIMKVHNKAIRLLEGGAININGNWFKLKQYPRIDGFCPCNECNLDSICREEHLAVCQECNYISGKKCCLHLVLTGRIY